MFRYVEIEGDAVSRGRAYGEQTADLIELAITTYRTGFAEKGFDWSDVIRIGEAFATRIAEFDREMHQELRGLAEGAGRKLGEIVALNARTELLYGVSSGGGTELGDVRDLSGEGCTGAVALPAATRDGRLIHGQNWDWREPAADFTIVLSIKPDRGPKILTLVEAGTLARCGLNSAGIAVTGNFLKGVDDYGRDGIPAPFIRRKALMSETMHDAMAAVITSKRSFSINVMISSAGGEAVNFETTPAQLFWIRPENDLLVHSNHFVSAGALASLQDMALHVTPDTLFRDVRVRRQLEQRRGDLVFDDFKTAFADRFDAPYAICRSPASGPGGSSAATLATVIMDAEQGVMDVAARPYLGVEFHRYEIGQSAPAETELV